jgi:hypothetical protein
MQRDTRRTRTLGFSGLEPPRVRRYTVVLFQTIACLIQGRSCQSCPPRDGNHGLKAHVIRTPPLHPCQVITRPQRIVQVSALTVKCSLAVAAISNLDSGLE